MKVQRGDVVFVDFPFSDRAGSKVRPALVVQCDANNRKLDDTIVVAITSRKRFAATEPTQLLVEVATPAGKQTGLLYDSAVQCENIVTIDHSFIIRRIGSFDASLMQMIEACLKAALDLS
jgi:mRNA interferase MazF